MARLPVAPTARVSWRPGEAAKPSTPISPAGRMTGEVHPTSAPPTPPASTPTTPKSTTAPDFNLSPGGPVPPTSATEKTRPKSAPTWRPSSSTETATRRRVRGSRKAVTAVEEAPIDV